MNILSCVIWIRHLTTLFLFMCRWCWRRPESITTSSRSLLLWETWMVRPHSPLTTAEESNLLVAQKPAVIFIMVWVTLDFQETFTNPDAQSVFHRSVGGVFWLADSLKASPLPSATFYDSPTAVFPLSGFGVEGKLYKILVKWSQNPLDHLVVPCVTSTVHHTLGL